MPRRFPCPGSSPRLPSRRCTWSSSRAHLSEVSGDLRFGPLEVGRRIDAWRCRSVEQRHTHRNTVQQRPELLESLPLLLGNGGQPHPCLQRFARICVHADMLMVDDLAAPVAIEGNGSAGEIHGASARIDDDFYATGIVDELPVERSCGRSERLPAFETGERAAHGCGCDEGLVAPDGPDVVEAAKLCLGN